LPGAPHSTSPIPTISVSAKHREAAIHDVGNTTVIFFVSSGISLAGSLAEETHMAKSESSDPTEIDPALEDDLVGAGDDDDFDDDDDDLEDEDEEEVEDEA
jgi:hypothetical protein